MPCLPWFCRPPLSDRQPRPTAWLLPFFSRSERNIDRTALDFQIRVALHRFFELTVAVMSGCTTVFVRPQ